ncbi:MAG: tRNA pseudouridine(38-40) synthase TruA [Frankiaceae bacterium]
MARPEAGDEPAVPDRDGGLVRLRLDLGYDGTAFAGWAQQRGRRTVQGEVQRGLATVLRLAEEPSLTVAGRTDAGVHARAQVAHVDLPATTWAAADPARVLRGLAAVLPPDVRVLALGCAPDGFDARFSALARVYGYRACDHPAGVHPLRRHDTLWHQRPLDLAAMRAAAEGLLGEHDFVAYCRRREGASTVRTLRRLDWTHDTDGALLALVEADAFCHSMVRSLVGALLAVGDGRFPVPRPAELLARGQRAGEVVVAPAHGLTLLEVRYPPEGELAARAARTRARRSLPAVG